MIGSRYIQECELREHLLCALRRVQGPITEAEINLLFKTARSVPKYQDKSGRVLVDINDVSNFLDNFIKSTIRDCPEYLNQSRGLCISDVVDIEKFVTDKDYFNKDPRPAIMDCLNEFWKPGEYYSEALLTGGTGIGKTFFAEASLAYMVYQLSCYHNPQVEFGLSPGSSIIFIIQSKTKDMAKRVIFNPFMEAIKSSAYFKEQFPWDNNYRSELRFPKNILVIPVSGADTAAIGLNVWGGIIDELNFMDVIEGGVMAKIYNTEEYDQATRLYNQLRRRIVSRFIQHGKVPGRLLLPSARRGDNDFTEKRLLAIEKEKEKLGKSYTYVMDMPQWKSIPEDRLSKNTFFVEVGDKSHMSKIIDSPEDAREGARVEEIPDDYLAEFENDVEGALLDIGGIVTGVKHKFIPYKDLLQKAIRDHKIKYGGRSLFKQGTIFLSSMDSEIPDWDAVVDHTYLKEYLISEDLPRVAHVDIGLNRKKGDAAGFGVGHISGYKILPSYRYYSEREKAFVEARDIHAPIYTIDGLLQIKAKPGDEVDLIKLQSLILYINSFLKIKWATADTYQSVMLIQGLRKAKIRSGDLSVDSSMAPYTELKLSIKEERLLVPDHEIFVDEIADLESDGKKVDHRPNKSKDVSDCAAGVVYILQRKEANFKGRGGSNRIDPEKEEKKSMGRVVRIRGGRQ